MSLLDTNMIMESMKDAQNKSLEYSPAERARDIRKLLDEIPPLVNRGYSLDDIKKMYPEEYKKYPQFIKKIVEKQDLSPIRGMLLMLDNMAKGNITQHNASIIVGKQLVDKYVKPQLNGTS